MEEVDKREEVLTVGGRVRHSDSNDIREHNGRRGDVDLRKDTSELLEAKVAAVTR